MQQSVLQAAKVLEDQVDAELERMERLDEDDIERLREKRLQQVYTWYPSGCACCKPCPLSPPQIKKAAAQRQEWVSQGHGVYQEIQGESDFFEECKKSEKLVCHFYRDSTVRCQIVDKHLNLLAPKHLETRFIKLSVERAPFLCQRLSIRILPTIACIINNITKDYIKGFDDLGGVDDFSTEMMEWRLGCADVLTYSGNLLEPPDKKKERRGMANRPKKTIRGGYNDDSDDD